MNINEELLDFLEASPTAYQAVDCIRRILEENGYAYLDEAEVWHLDEGKKYYTTRNGSSLIAFRIPENHFHSFMIGASHGNINWNFKQIPDSSQK